jgi:hypothetical protein
MTSTEFKKEIKNKRDYLKGKKIKLIFISGDTNYSGTTFSFSNLRSFGEAILNLEGIGAVSDS